MFKKNQLSNLTSIILCKRICLLAILSLLLAPLSFGQSVSQTEQPIFVKNEIIIKLKDTEEATKRDRQNKRATGISKIDAICSKAGGFTVKNFSTPKSSKSTTNKHRMKTQNIVALKYDSDVDIESIIRELENIADIEYAEPNYIAQVHTVTMGEAPAELVPNDYISRMYWAKNDGTFTGFNDNAPAPVVDADIDATDAWEITTGNSNVTLAVLDSGIDPTNQEFAGRIVQGYDFVNEDDDPTDDHAHGTNVTGIATMTGNNNFGLAGVDWNCKIMPIKVLDENNFFVTALDAAEGINYAVDNGADVMNMSFGFSSNNPQVLQDAIQDAYNAGVILICSAGNDDGDITSYPALYTQTITVGATDLNDHRVRTSYTGGFWGSNYGDKVDLVAPGNWVVSARYNDNQAFTWWMGGTSQATPMVSGAATLLLGIDPSLTQEDIRTILRDTADDQVGDPNEDTPGYDIYHGAGRLNLHKAVLAVSGFCTVGEPCDDGDVCTTGEIYQEFCLCGGGTLLADDDNDGICNLEDVCANFDDNLVGEPCDDGDPCTAGEIYDNNCNCSGGVYQDFDFDGFCTFEDPDDFDGCNPNPDHPNCLPCLIYDDEDFESGPGIWNEGPSSPDLDTDPFCASGTCYFIDNNTGNIFTNPIDFTNKIHVNVSFDYSTDDHDTNESFSLDVSNNGGSTFTTVAQWVNGVDYTNGTQTNSGFAMIPLNLLSSNTIIKFQSGASHNGERTYLDNIKIEPCAFDGPPPNCTIGAPCDDTNPNTINDVFLPGCLCAGTYTPNCDSALAGTPCNDGDVCTTGETYDTDCNCTGGTFQDIDNDDVCDAEDVCPDGDDNIDSDGDGIPDACDDDETECTVGATCDDGNACTTGATYDANCNCTGGTVQDADNDGVCDANDACPNLDDNLIGTACDDGNPNTSNDTWASNCICAGILEQDECSITMQQASVVPYADNQDYGTAVVLDNGNTILIENNGWKAIPFSYNVTANTVMTFDFKATAEGEEHSIGLDADLGLSNINRNKVFGTQSDSGANEAFDNYNTLDSYKSYSIPIGQYYSGQMNYMFFIMDNDANATQGDSYFSNISIFEDANGNGINDECSDSCTIGMPCDDGDDCTIFDAYNIDCECVGIFADYDNDGVCDADDVCPFGDDTVDSDGDGIPDACDDDEEECSVGFPCDDNDDCTTFDAYNIDCECVGVFADNDNDGVCNAEDVCPFGDDNIDSDGDGIPDACDDDEEEECFIGTPCDDGDDCTMYEYYDFDCNCVGVYLDTDNDGICDADDACPFDPANNCEGEEDGYCHPTVFTSEHRYISNVNFASIDNDSQYDNGYADYTSLSTNVSAGSTVNISLTTDGGIPTFVTHAWGVWIDYNQDGDFDDFDEEAFMTLSTESTATGIITIPANVADGATRMRVIINYGSSLPTPCGDIIIGEIEDYTVQLSGGVDGCTVGTPCNDGDDCTINDVLDADCNCDGTYQDSDNDNICDADDACPLDPANNCVDAPDYCDSYGSNTDYEYIDRVEFGNIDNTSGDDGGYGDYTDHVATVGLGDLVPLGLAPGFTGHSYNEVWTVWIDFDQDGYYGYHEQVYFGISAGSLSGHAIIPPNATLGQTGMRVAMQWSRPAGACDAFTYGEVEDYIVNITDTPQNYPLIDLRNEDNIVANPSIRIHPNPTTDFININLQNARDNGSMKIVTMSGKIVFEQGIDAETNDLQIAVNTLPAGVYLIQLDLGGNTYVTERFVKLSH